MAGFLYLVSVLVAVIAMADDYMPWYGYPLTLIPIFNTAVAVDYLRKL